MKYFPDWSSSTFHYSSAHTQYVLHTQMWSFKNEYMLHHFFPENFQWLSKTQRMTCKLFTLTCMFTHHGAIEHHYGSFNFSHLSIPVTLKLSTILEHFTKALKSRTGCVLLQKHETLLILIWEYLAPLFHVWKVRSPSLPTCILKKKLWLSLVQMSPQCSLLWAPWHALSNLLELYFSMTFTSF